MTCKKCGRKRIDFTMGAYHIFGLCVPRDNTELQRPRSAKGVAVQPTPDIKENN